MESFSSCSSSCSIAFSPADSSHSTTQQQQQQKSCQPQHHLQHHTRGKRDRGAIAGLMPLPIPAVPDRENGSPSDHHHPDMSASATIRKYRGIRMRKWGKWVAEIREPNKRSRIWLGSYSSPVAAARAYDTAVFFLRGRSARLNFPEEIGTEPEAAGVLAGSAAGLSAASIRQKAAEVGARVDALHAGSVGAGAALGDHKQRHNSQHHHHQNHNCSLVKKEEDDDDDDVEDARVPVQLATGKGAAITTASTTTAAWKKPDLNRQPSPECSEDEEEYSVIRAC